MKIQHLHFTCLLSDGIAKFARPPPSQTCEVSAIGTAHSLCLPQMGGTGGVTSEPTGVIGVTQTGIRTRETCRRRPETSVRQAQDRTEREDRKEFRMQDNREDR